MRILRKHPDSILCLYFSQHMFVLGYACRHLIKLPYFIPQGQRNYANNVHDSLPVFEDVIFSCASYGLKNGLKEVCVLIFRGLARRGGCENKDVQCFPAGGWVVGRHRERKRERLLGDV